MNIMDATRNNLCATLTAAARRGCLMEFILSLAYVFSAVASSIYYGKKSDSIVAIALANTFVVIMGIYASAKFSGGYLNPLITVSVASRGKISWTLCWIYCLLQIVGSAVAISLLQSLTGHKHLPLHTFTVTTLQAVALEGLMTLVLILTVHASASEPFLIGFAYGINILVCWRFTGGYMNPAIFLGAYITASNAMNYKVYLFAPLAGASLAMVLDYFLNRGPAPPGAEPSDPGMLKTLISVFSRLCLYFLGIATCF